MGEADEPLTRHHVTDLGGGSFQIALEGELDLSTADAVRDAVENTINSVTETLVLELSGLRFADSSAIALWVTWSQRVPRVEIRHAQPMILRVIQTMGLSGRLNPR